ncbi:MAG: rhodanese-like domain-containing protein [Deltaproteobacteria bacterium]|nr:rhodanese-like domain-containing protein [Deltaproteobacteria bacterium]MBW2178145.1 rhodanese-like domain-containing protein [Deltaproteobacteria bacterium]MBW2298211.1 rhodanese-like domain-containing protein [Deltaproteobacteria bacterium]
MRSFLFPGIVVAVTIFVLWYSHLPVSIVASNMAQVEREAARGGYRLIDVETLSKRYQSARETILLVDTRQEWEHRTGHIAESVNFPMEPTWWARWQKKGALNVLLGPDKGKTIVFY